MRLSPAWGLTRSRPGYGVQMAHRLQSVPWKGPRYTLQTLDVLPHMQPSPTPALQSLLGLTEIGGGGGRGRGGGREKYKGMTKAPP